MTQSPGRIMDPFYSRSTLAGWSCRSGWRSQGGESGFTGTSARVPTLQSKTAAPPRVSMLPSRNVGPHLRGLACSTTARRRDAVVQRLSVGLALRERLYQFVARGAAEHSHPADLGAAARRHREVDPLVAWRRERNAASLAVEQRTEHPR